MGGVDLTLTEKEIGIILIALSKMKGEEKEEYIKVYKNILKQLKEQNNS